MARKKYYLGDFGPYFYDPDIEYSDPDGDFDGSFRVALKTDGVISAAGTPTEDNDLVRLQDLTGVSGGVTGSFISQDGKIVVITNGIIVGLL